MPATASYTARSTQEFGLSLLAELAAHSKENICISPISICLCLQLALYGARGTTAAEILKTLAILAPDRESLPGDAEKLMKRLETLPSHSSFEGPGASVKLALANSIWVHDAVQINSNYAAVLQDKYKAACTSLDFGAPQSLNIINSWVDQATAHKIPGILDKLEPSNMLVLINCAYFKARWNQQFLPEHTTNRDFHLSNNTVLQVPTMQMEEAWLPYSENENGQIVQLDYTDSRFSMYVLLPAKGANLNTFVSELTFERWQSCVSQLRVHQGIFALPKFKLEFMVELKDSLKKLGMTQAFSGEADFLNMLGAEQDLPEVFGISKVIHRTFIAVDEQGTEAAAATAIVMWGSAAIPAPPPPFKMIVDRPFLYAVCDKSTGTILFLGTVIDPRN